MRRRVLGAPGNEVSIGNTSACAEKSTLARGLQVNLGKYLRVCGEEMSAIAAANSAGEIPPRVRRRVHASR